MPRVVDVVFSSFSMPPRIWDESLTRIKWYSLKNYDLRSCTDTVLEAVQDQSQAKNILVSCYQKYAGSMEVSKLTKHFDEIVNAVKAQSNNMVVFGTCFFIPNSSAVWDKVGDLNDKIRAYNDALEMPPCNLHKMGTTWISDQDRTLRVRGMYYAQFQLNLGLGIDFSIEGLLKIKSFVIQTFDNSFTPYSYKRQTNPVRVKVPPPLCKTPGYMNNEFHMQELRDRNLTGRPSSTGGERRTVLTWGEWKPEGWRCWDVYKRNTLWTKEQRERALERHLEELHQSDARPVWNEHVQADQEKDLIDFSEEVHHDSAEDQEVERLTRDMSLADEEEEKEIEEVDYIEGYISPDEFGIDRYDRVNEELVKSYRKELSNKNEKIAKERAASRHWKGAASKREDENIALTDDISYYKRRVKVLESQLKRVSDEYRYLKDLYEQSGVKRGVKVVRKFAKSKDFI